MSGRVLITMDDLEVGVPVNAALEEAGLTTAMVSSFDDLRAAVRRAEPEVVVFTGALHERPARELAALARERDAARLALLEPGGQDPGRLVHALGLSAWLVKPMAPAEVASAVQRLIERRRLQERTGILGDSAAIHEVLVKIEQMAPVSSTVLVEGESGTGKELVAQAMHSLSARRERPFIAVNCAALPESLL
ncbi:MAG TPA: sigma 54-interacting transcriptional regulator, partial [Gemmatimonadales bacterium]